MAFDPTPWMIAGGAQHSADLARTLAFASLSGAEGVVLPESLKVTARNPVASGITIGSGACVILNRSPGASEQSYVGRAGSSTNVAIAATTAAARSDLVVVRVEDPQYPPWTAPSNMATGVFIKPFVVQNVSAGTTSAEELNLGYPAIALARIDIPSGTSLITSAMVKDVRKVARPRRERYLFSSQADTVSNLFNGSDNTWFMWPSTANWQVDVPEWATVAIIKGTVAGARMVAGDMKAQVRALLGSLATQGTEFDWITLNAGSLRQDISFGGTIAITSDLRGTTQTLRVQGGTLQATNPAQVQTDRYSSTFVDIEFQERAV